MSALIERIKPIALNVIEVTLENGEKVILHELNKGLSLIKQ